MQKVSPAIHQQSHQGDIILQQNPDIQPESKRTNSDSWQQMVWPPQSFNLNIIKPVWDYMKGQKTERQPESTEQLCSKMSATTYLPSPWRRRVSAGLKANGCNEYKWTPSFLFAAYNKKVMDTFFLADMGPTALQTDTTKNCTDRNTLS